MKTKCGSGKPTTLFLPLQLPDTREVNRWLYSQPRESRKEQWGSTERSQEWRQQKKRQGRRRRRSMWPGCLTSILAASSASARLAVGKKNRDQRGHCLPTLLLEAQTRLEARTTDPQLRPAGQKLHPPPTLGIPDMASRTATLAEGGAHLCCTHFRGSLSFPQSNQAASGTWDILGRRWGCWY